MRSNPSITLAACGCLALVFAAGCEHDTQQHGRESVRLPAGKETDVQLSSARVSADETVGNIETVAYFNGPMPTGVAVSKSGRKFVCYPKWGDIVKFTVAEIKGSDAVAYPSERYNAYNAVDPGKSFMSVQSVVIDSRDRLWAVDTGSTSMGTVVPGAAKLVCINLESNTVAKTITFPPTVALPTSYLNDVRFDLTRGSDGMAYITDSSDRGPNGIIVVDLGSGQSWRRLNDEPSTKADPSFSPISDGDTLMIRTPPLPKKPVTIGADGIAISNDGKTLYYCPLISRHLYSVSVDALSDRARSDAEVSATVQDLGDRGFASDGLESDSQGRIYLTDYEHNGVRVRDTSGTYKFIARSPQIVWPDTLALGNDGYLYFINNQLQRQSKFHDNKDMRKTPFTLLRVKVEGGPITAGANQAP